MSWRPFKQVDVFTSVPYLGNPVAVVLDANGLDSSQMQRIANWTNLSETTFVLTPTVEEADYRVRIFTPGSELPFGGHPTIGTAHALLEAGITTVRGNQLVQQCSLGLVRLRVGMDGSGERSIAFELPAALVTDLADDALRELQEIVGTPFDTRARPRLIDVGARWIVAQLENASAVLSARPDLARMALQDRRHKATGVLLFGAYESGATARVEVRAFAPSHGVNEDPVCGSGSGCMAVFMRDSGQARSGSRFVASQGQVVGRAGLLHIGIEAESITVGGSSVTCFDGRMSV